MTNDVLPRWLRVTFTAITEYPSTNGIKVNALALVWATGGFLAAASILGSDISEGALAIWTGLLSWMMGVGTYQQSRKWEQFGKPTTPDTEDIAATQGTAAATAAGVSAPVLTRDVAERAAVAYAGAAEPRKTDDESGP
jgi:predicted membrane protein